MIINSSNVGMESVRTYRSTTTRTLNISANSTVYLRSFADNALGNQDLLGSNQQQELGTEEESSTAAEKQSATEAMERMRSNSNPLLNRIREISRGEEKSAIERIREKCVLHLWQLFFGKDKAKELAEEYSLDMSQLEPMQPRQIQVMTITGTEEYFFEEQEKMEFSTTGTVRTADGREISFNLNVGMSRSFSEYYKREGVEVAAMCDPLVINLDSDVVGVSDQKFFFDLDMDGKEEEISTLETGNAFLALDRNRDGTINDGSELFGAKSGNGFSELAEFDEDGNGWIDEADSVYDKLKIWVKDENGEDKLYTLKEKNVGAIYLGSADTQYTLRSAESGKVNGAIRKSGMFLYEDGAVGSIAHVDMAMGISESA